MWPNRCVFGGVALTLATMTLSNAAAVDFVFSPIRPTRYCVSTPAPSVRNVAPASKDTAACNDVFASVSLST